MNVSKRMVAVLVMLAAGSVMAGVTAPVAAPPAESERSFCDWWDLAKLYENPENAFIQSFVLSGRLQADAAFYDSDQGSYDALLWRRFRFGAKMGFWNDFLLHVEADIDLNEMDPLYNRLTDAYIAWAPSKAFRLKVGKHSARFTLDGGITSKKILTVERSNLSNNLWFPVEYFSGVRIDGKINQWSYKAGYFSSRRDDEFGDFEYFDAGSGQFILASLGYDLGERIGWDKALVRLDYVHNEVDEESDGTRKLGNIGSLVLNLENDKWGFWSDLSAGDGHRGQSDLWGLQLMPFYNFTDKIQGVFRYTHLKSRDENGLRLGRYENRIVSGRGDEYNDFYLGLNYYLCGQKLKIQTGVTYTDMKDSADDGGRYKGWGWTTGFRMYW